ncbi:Phosphatase YbjI [Nocardia africana]|uniref:Phosphatase YbjI n=1 Tax=Nocardia africana TaxID=134964 RepID=A0A378WJZ3_9NOCA|nr:Phosphatase YbjI [Nocardia africana]
MSRQEVISAPAIKMLIRLRGTPSAQMQSALEPHLAGRADITYSTNNGLIELSAPGITKAAGLSVVAERLGVDPAAILAFGDMPNDVPMLRMAGHGVAMGNAHPKPRPPPTRSPPPTRKTAWRGCSSAGGRARARPSVGSALN